jgi:FlhB-like protein
VGLLVGVLLIPGALAATAAHASTRLIATLAGGGRGTGAGVESLPLDVLALTAPLVGAIALVALGLGWAQTGGVVSFARLAPRLERLDPVQGLQGLFRGERLFALVRALVGATLVVLITVSLLRSHAGDIAALAGNERAVGYVVGVLGKRLGVLVALAGVGLGLVDLVIVHRSWRQRHRMSKDEIRREYREAEGDPEVRARRKRAHQEALAGSIVNAVREATVVIVNPTHLASALRYDQERDEAPKVVAQGEGELARAIVQAAHAYGIPCIQDVPIARALRELEIGDEIPEALYEAVAEILREVLSPAS